MMLEAPEADLGVHRLCDGFDFFTLRRRRKHKTSQSTYFHAPVPSRCSGTSFASLTQHLSFFIDVGQ